MDKDDVKIGETTPEYPDLIVKSILNYWIEESLTKPVNIFNLKKGPPQLRYNWIVNTDDGHRLIQRVPSEKN